MTSTAPSISSPNALQIILSQLRLTLLLLWRFWPQLAALWLIGFIGNLVLNELAAAIGRWNSLAGLSMLAVVVLLKLVIIVALFETVRPGLPTLEKASRAPDPQTGTETDGSYPGFVTALALTLVPFFAFYAAWGFLADTVRDYSRLSLDLFMSGEATDLLKVTGGAWLFVSVAIAWAVRRFAKWMHKRSKASIWPVVIVICEANWAFIGLFVVSQWQGDIRAWFSHLPDALGHFLGILQPVGEAAAKTSFPPPPEMADPPLGKQIKAVFLYALYPVVWLTLAALVYGYDINGDRPVGEGRLSRALSRWQALPKSARDFISHFIAGTLKRYRALAEGVGLALNSGIGLLLVAIVLYRLLDWGAAWAWFGLVQLIGPHDLPLWQIVAQAISLFFGNPSEPGDGLLIMPIKVCLLAATLEIGFAQGREWRRRKA